MSLKKIIYFCGFIFLSIVVILNLVFTAYLDSSEHITISYNSFIYILGLAFTSVLIFFASKYANKYLYNDTDKKSKKKIRRIITIVAIVLYALFNIIWVVTVLTPVVGDQIHACNLAQTFYRGNYEEFLPNLTYAGIPLSEYMQAYHQQISLAFAFSLLFRILHFDWFVIFREVNVFADLLIIFALYKIVSHLAKKYEVNKTLFFTLILTFISLPLLSTFIYGDTPSLALCLFAVYFMMKYTETKKIKYPIFASLLTCFAYMMRMNSLIFIIATVIYLVLALFKEFKNITWKDNLIKSLVILGYITISILPTTLVQNYYLNKFDLDKSKEYPSISYVYMAMMEGPRANGWYNEGIGEPALRDPEGKKIEYLEKIKERLTYFAKNPGYTFDFYTKKLASMWAENTYSAVENNMVGDVYKLDWLSAPLTFYQKALLLTTCILCLVVLIQNRKDLSLEILFLITIFIGGFAFHILWEAKSRYIIPYIVVLIPVASVAVKGDFAKVVNKLKAKK